MDTRITAKVEEKVYTPFKVGGVWKVWDPKQCGLRILKGVKVSKEYPAVYTEVEKIEKGRGNRRTSAETKLEIERARRQRNMRTPAQREVQTELEALRMSQKHLDVAIKSGKVKEDEPKEKAIPVEFDPLQLEFRGGEKAEISSDGKIWHKPIAYGGQAFVPLRDRDLLLQLTGDQKGYKTKAQLLCEPDLVWKVGRRYIIAWAERLAAYSTEALCIYGKLRIGEPTGDRPLWLAVVPQQECTACGVDVDNFGPAVALLSKRGYRMVGTIHTHPGGGVPSCSGIDERQLWNDLGGIHLIASKTGYVAGYYSLGGESWRMGMSKEAAWHIPKLWEGTLKMSGTCGTLISETGGKTIKKMITEPVRKATGYQQNFGFNQGLNNRIGESKVGEIITVGGTSYRWSEGLHDLVEIYSPKPDYKREVPKIGEIGEFSNLAIVEIMNELIDRSLPRPQHKVREVLASEVERMVTAWQTLEYVVTILDKKKGCSGAVRGAIEYVKNQMFFIEMELIGNGC